MYIPRDACKHIRDVYPIDNIGISLLDFVKVSNTPDPSGVTVSGWCLISLSNNEPPFISSVQMLS